MSQRNVELFIGRLMTDSALRRRFMAAPQRAIEDFCEQGWELSPGESGALVAMDVKLWFLAAAGLPSRLQRCSLKSDEGSG
jgi:hypothetical protein